MLGLLTSPVYLVHCTITFSKVQKTEQLTVTEQGGSVVMHETRIREVPGSNPGADQPD